MNSARVIKLDGAPGAGKTHTLKQRLSEERHENGVGPYDMYWLNFTNSGREDVESDILDVFAGCGEDEEDVERRAKTFHGLALSLCLSEELMESVDPIENQIIQQGSELRWGDQPHAVFCERHGIPFDPEATNSRKLLSGEKSTQLTGNKLFAIADYLRQTCKPVDQWRCCPVEISIPGARVRSLLKKWDEFKKTEYEHRLFEHGDYVEEAFEMSLTPDVDVLLIDEFQDLAPLEYRLYKFWRDSGGLERMYIAGDANQSIYSFRGGTPVYFDETDVDESVTLKESYRCPAEIADVAAAVLDSNRATSSRGFSGVEDGGCVDDVRVRSKRELRNSVVDATAGVDAEPAVMLLTRTNSQLRSLMRDLQSVGMPFELLGSQSSMWEGDLGGFLTALKMLRDEVGSYPSESTEALIGLLPGGDERVEMLPHAYGEGDGTMYTDGQLADALPEYDEITEFVDLLELPAWKRTALNNALDAPASVSHDELRVGTMHSAKGLEAPVVYLFCSTSRSTVRRYQRYEDAAAEEHRTYYVGVSRASERLNLVENYFSGPLAPPIKRMRAHGVITA